MQVSLQIPILFCQGTNPDPGSGSGSAFSFQVGSGSAFSFQVGSGSAKNGCGSETLQKINIGSGIAYRCNVQVRFRVKKIAMIWILNFRKSAWPFSALVFSLSLGKLLFLTQRWEILGTVRYDWTGVFQTDLRLDTSTKGLRQVNRSTQEIQQKTYKCAFKNYLLL